MNEEEWPSQGWNLHQAKREHELQVAVDAADLVLELWPQPSSATVHVEAHQWKRLRKVLLETVAMGAGR